MEKEEVFKKLQAIIAELLAADNAEETATIQSLGGDSLDTMDIISEIERTFKIKISDNDAVGMDGMNLGQLTEEIIKRLPSTDTDKAAEAEDKTDND